MISFESQRKREKDLEIYICKVINSGSLQIGRLREYLNILHCVYFVMFSKVICPAFL